MSTSLFQLTDERAEIDRILAVFDGEVTDEEFEQQIDEILLADRENKEAFAKKVDNYIWLIDELRGSSGLKKQKASQMSESAKTEDNKADRLEGRLMACIQLLGKDEVAGVYRKAKIVGNGGKQPITFTFTELSEVPKKYRILKKEEALDKDKVREYLESGKTLPFAKLEDRGKRLSIK